MFQFENEIITKLDSLVEKGRGDEHYKDLFHTLYVTISNRCCEIVEIFRKSLTLYVHTSFNSLSCFSPNRMSNLFEQHSVMRREGVAFVDTIKELLQRLLEYRAILNDESKDNRMSCTVNLLVGIITARNGVAAR